MNIEQDARDRDPAAEPEIPAIPATARPSPKRQQRVLLGYSITIFISSALLLVLEIVAGRLVAPYIGVSLYTWTSIIGVILAGLSLGNWLGGVRADRGGSGRDAGLVLALSGIYCLLSLPALDLLGRFVQQQGFTLLTTSFLFAAGLFFVPAALIGVVSPLLTTLALRLDPRAGHIVGRMHALAAIGSICGTFIAGYWLVQSFGTRAVVIGSGLALMLLSAPFLRHARRWLILGLIVAAVAAGLLAQARDSLAGTCDRESSYFCIRVVDHSADAPFGEARGMVLDHLLHGINHASDPAMLIAPYVHALDELVHAQFGEHYQQGLRYFFAGGGAYSQPRAVRALSPSARITVAELDPEVTRTAIDALFLDPSTLRILHRDARLALQDETGPFDVIIGDVFHDVAVPYHLLTRELTALARQRLAPAGLFAMNLVDAFPDPRLLKALLKTLATEFRFVDVWMEGMPEATRATYVITASNHKRLPEMVRARRGFDRTWLRVTDAILEIGTPLDDLPLLTDDYAPVERLIADLLIGENR